MTLYDSYIRALKWASLRIRDRGVVAYVTNGGWLDSNTADGMRRALSEEFSDIYVLNLRGNQRTAGELSRKEGGKVFGGGSRATVAVTMLVKDSRRKGPARVHYSDIGEYLSREDKLAKVAAAEEFSGLDSIGHIIPNEAGDWISQRSSDFAQFITLGDKRRDEKLFKEYSGGLSTARDSWAFNSSASAVEAAIRRLVATYQMELDSAVENPRHSPSLDASRISWSTVLRGLYERRRQISYNSDYLTRAVYRPFFRQAAYWHSSLIHSAYQLGRMFPEGSLSNHGFFSNGFNAQSHAAFLMLDAMPSLDVFGKGGQFFARWQYEKIDGDDGMLNLDTPYAGDDEMIDGYRKIDNVTDHALTTFRAAYGEKVTKDDIFFYVYGLLHSPEYRETYSADLKKMLPRIPLVTDPWPFVAAGRKLSELHLGYESITPYPLEGLDVEGPAGDAAYDFFAVDKKMKFTDKVTRAEIVYNSRITLGGIPAEAYRYMLGARSAIEWIMDRYWVKTDKASGIVNDPNDWSREVGDPRYIIDLLARIVTVSLETMAIVDALPALDMLPSQNPLGKGSM